MFRKGFRSASLSPGTKAAYGNWTCKTSETLMKYEPMLPPVLFSSLSNLKIMQSTINKKIILTAAFKSYANLLKSQNNPKSITNYQIARICWFINPNPKL
jgi:hypothetical protein